MKNPSCETAAILKYLIYGCSRTRGAHRPCVLRACSVHLVPVIWRTRDRRQGAPQHIPLGAHLSIFFSPLFLSTNKAARLASTRRSSSPRLASASLRCSLHLISSWRSSLGITYPTRIRKTTKLLTQPTRRGPVATCNEGSQYVHCTGIKDPTSSWYTIDLRACTARI